MSNQIVPLDAAQLGHLVATNIQRSAKGETPYVESIAASIAEVTVETQTLGASLLAITIIDPGWVITRSGFLDVNADGLLDEIDINFPPNSGLWWRLAMLDLTNNLAQPNLTLTFQDRVVSYLQDCWGPVINSAGSTRAEFIKSLIDRMPGELHQLDEGTIGVGPIKPAFVCKELKVTQPVAGQVTSGGTTFVTDTATQNSAATKINKKAVGATRTGGGAWQVTASAESLGGNGSCRPIQAEGYSELSTVPMGTASDFAALGKIPCLTPMIITNPANGKSVTAVKQDIGAGSSFLPVMGLYPSTVQQLGLSGGQFTVIIERADGVPLKPVRGTPTTGTSPTGGTAGGTTTTTTSDLAQLTRGTSNDQDEDTWTACQRLAAEVNWPLFSNGDTIFYDPGTSLIQQAPALYLELDATGTSWTARNPVDNDTARDVVVTLDAVFDNSAYRYQATKKKKGKVQRATRIRKPQTPSQIRLNMVCGVLDYRAGDVFVFRGSGPLNGPWLVVDTTRNCLADRHTQFTLAPGTAPNPEPSSTTTNTSAAISGSPASNAALYATSITSPHTGAGVAQAAMMALANQKATHAWSYSQQRPPNGGNPLMSSPHAMDCSGFAALCFIAAGLGNPSHISGSAGNTSSMIAFCKPVSSPQPGDLGFFGAGGSDHVNVVVGNGQSVSMGAQGDPSIGPTAAMGPSGFIGTYRSDLVARAGPTPPMLASAKAIVGGVSVVSSGLNMPSLFGT